MLERFFGSQEPDRKPPADDVDPDALRIFNMVVNVTKDRDRLSDENDRLRITLSDVKRERDFYREKLGEAERHRDFYQRHYIALHARVQDRINNLAGAVSDAASEAEANGVPTQAAVNLDEIERNIQELARSADRPNEQTATVGREAALTSHQLEEPKV